MIFLRRTAVTSLILTLFTGIGYGTDAEESTDTGVAPSVKQDIASLFNFCYNFREEVIGVLKSV
jgi:hypothetical protein